MNLNLTQITRRYLHHNENKSLLHRGGWCPASPAPPPPPVFWKKDFYSARVLLNPPLPHLSPATSPSRAVGAQPEPTGPGSQPQEERKDTGALLPPWLQAPGEGKLRRKLLPFPASQQCKLASQQWESMNCPQGKGIIPRAPRLSPSQRHGCDRIAGKPQMASREVQHLVQNSL